MKKIISYGDPLFPGQQILTPDQFISQEAYKEVVQKMIITCTDIVIYLPNDPALYLVKRSVFPMKGIWRFGGRMFFNDTTPELSAARCLQAETGLEIDPERFSLIRTDIYAWNKVKQGDFPGKNLVIVYGCEVSDEEISQMSQGLSEKEYEKTFGIQRFDLDRLKAEKVHPALIDLYQDVFPD